MSVVNLPKSLVIDKLIEKTKEVDGKYDFDYMGILNELRQKVTQEASYINVTFPEYTPHDNNYHFKNLFQIAETVLGEKLISEMNVNELFILVCALYGHDWGMAVSRLEKECIITNRVPKGAESHQFVLLPDEHVQFQKYLKSQHVDIDIKVNELEVSKISDDIWGEYVRSTHALRSGAE